MRNITNYKNNGHADKKCDPWMLSIYTTHGPRNTYCLQNIMKLTNLKIAYKSAADIIMIIYNKNNNAIIILLVPMVLFLFYNKTLLNGLVFWKIQTFFKNI